MPHFRKLFDERFVGAWDFEGKESVTVKIRAIGLEEMQDQSGSKTKKPVLFFEKAKKGLVLNKTNAKTIAELYGSNTDKWVGQSIALFATTCDAFGKKVECVRVRNQKPSGRSAPKQPQPDTGAGSDLPEPTNADGDNLPLGEGPEGGDA